MWGATPAVVPPEAAAEISIHAPRVGSDNQLKRDDPYIFISIHAPRVGSDSFRLAATDNVAEFQSTLPVWGATLLWAKSRRLSKNFNPRSPCGERPVVKWGYSLREGISIHAPRVGSDYAWQWCHAGRENFNPRSPCGERHLILMFMP